MRKLLSCIGAVLLLAGAPACSQTGGDDYGAGAGQKESAMKFDRALWIDEGKFYDEPFPRLKMLSDVRGNVIRNGMTRQQVIEALGEPSDSGKFADRGLAYWIAPEQGMVSIDSQWLIVALDANGAVTGTDIATD